jgi:hypothetical protein
MQLLYVNNTQLDLDEGSAIGLDMQSYDIKNPATIFQPVSNNFSVPKTKRNLKTLGFAGNAHSLSSIVYSQMSCDYIVNGVQMIKNGIANVTDVDSRINMFASGKEDIWGKLKKETWKQFNADFILWLQTNKGLPSISSPYSGTFANFISTYVNSTEGLHLPIFMSNYYSNGSESGANILLQNETSLGGHFSVYIKTIFEFIEDFYGVDFSVLDETLDYNIFEDAIASIIQIPFKNLRIYHTSSTEFYFEYKDNIPFYPYNDISIDKEDKTLYDLVKIFFQYFNCLIDRTIKSDGSAKYIIRRFDDIENAPEINFTGRLTGTNKFKPSVEGWKQKNWIKFSKLYEDADSTVNSKFIECFNENIEVGLKTESLFDISMYIPNQLLYGGDYILNLSKNDALKEFTLIIDDPTLITTTVTSIHNSITVSSATQLHQSRLYELSSEYTKLETMLAYPVYYEVEKYLKFIEVNNIQYFAKYHIPELGGYFFLNKIKGFNPLSQNSATKLELIKL